MNRLTTDEIRRFEVDGYLAVEGVFDPESDFKVLKREYSEILDSAAAKLLADGEIESYDPSLPFEERVMEIVRQTGGLNVQPFDISLPQKGIGADTPMYLGRGAFDLMRHPPLIDLVEQLIGPEVYSNPVQHIRMKVPERLGRPDSAATKPGIPGIARSTRWHQDSGVVTQDADETNMLTAWVPVNDATAERGCLGVVPGSHRNSLVGHCPTSGGPTIPDNFIEQDDMAPVPLPAGSVLFLTRYTMHRSLPNMSDTLRCSFDLRYQPIGQPTGRAAFPGFVVRSKMRPSSVLSDHGEWASLWERARDDLASGDEPSFNRWSADAPWCA